MLYNSRLCCLCHLIIQSVIIRCLYILYIYNIYESLVGSSLPKFYLEKTMWLVCIHCVLRAHVQELKKSLVTVCLLYCATALAL